MHVTHDPMRQNDEGKKEHWGHRLKLSKHKQPEPGNMQNMSRNHEKNNKNEKVSTLDSWT